MNPQTINDIFFGNAERGLERVMWSRVSSESVPTSAGEFYRVVAVGVTMCQRKNPAKQFRRRTANLSWLCF
jgi:hypothetical protein